MMTVATAAEESTASLGVDACTMILMSAVPGSFVTVRLRRNATVVIEAFAAASAITPSSSGIRDA
ncbi:unannotated protein [freshwater metagenome]|uniref:Unannotated protein n=1 Tax=freshwater metagenome TaxID=449393 RepID=A0A6J7KXB5_9ZZZZ